MPKPKPASKARRAPKPTTDKQKQRNIAHDVLIARLVAQHKAPPDHVVEPRRRGRKPRKDEFVGPLPVAIAKHEARRRQVNRQRLDASVDCLAALSEADRALDGLFPGDTEVAGANFILEECREARKTIRAAYEAVMNVPVVVGEEARATFPGETTDHAAARVLLERYPISVYRASIEVTGNAEDARSNLAFTKQVGRNTTPKASKPMTPEQKKKHEKEWERWLVGEAKRPR